jgi:hypothetical protein
MTRRARHRLRTSLFAILCLVFQQAAVAAYLCPVQQMPAQMQAMADHCVELGMEQAKTNPALCDKHCTPDQPLATDASQLSVPPMALAPLAFEPVIELPADKAAAPAEVPIARSDPPPRLRYCSLLI